MPSASCVCWNIVFRIVILYNKYSLNGRVIYGMHGKYIVIKEIYKFRKKISVVTACSWNIFPGPGGRGMRGREAGRHRSGI